MEIEKSLTKKQKLKLSISNYVSYYYNSTKPVLQKNRVSFSDAWAVLYCRCCAVLRILCDKNHLILQKPTSLISTGKKIVIYWIIILWHKLLLRLKLRRSSSNGIPTQNVHKSKSRLQTVRVLKTDFILKSLVQPLSVVVELEREM